MTSSSITIRTATPDDTAALLAIYAPYVTKTAITFEYEVPSEEEFRRRIQTTLEAYPYLVAERGGKIIGYVYASAFHTRPAYDWNVETSIYIAKEARHTGAGRKLYEALETYLRAQGIVTLYACITRPIPMWIRTASISTAIWATTLSPTSKRADINSTAGTTSYGWKKRSVRIGRPWPL